MRKQYGWHKDKCRYFKLIIIFDVIRTNLYHDRFIIVDNELYNISSSIKDIGKKISHISKLESIDVDNLLNKYI